MVEEAQEDQRREAQEPRPLVATAELGTITRLPPVAAAAQPVPVVLDALAVTAIRPAQTPTLRAVAEDRAVRPVRQGRMAPQLSVLAVTDLEEQAAVRRQGRMARRAAAAQEPTVAAVQAVTVAVPRNGPRTGLVVVVAAAMAVTVEQAACMAVVGVEHVADRIAAAPARQA